MSSCDLPRQVKIIDTPHPQVGDMQRENIVSLDLTGCNVAYMHLAMNEFELANTRVGHRFHTWPPEIQIACEIEIEAWLTRNPKASVKGITQGVNQGVCILALHWRPKS